MKKQIENINKLLKKIKIDINVEYVKTLDIVYDLLNSIHIKDKVYVLKNIYEGSIGLQIIDRNEFVDGIRIEMRDKWVKMFDAIYVTNMSLTMNNLLTMDIAEELTIEEKIELCNIYNEEFEY